jgi:hypothetical protein
MSQNKYGGIDACSANDHSRLPIVYATFYLTFRQLSLIFAGGESAGRRQAQATIHTAQERSHGAMESH